MTLIVYLYKKFFPAFLGTLLFFSFTLELVDILMNLWKYISNAVALKEILQISILYLPKSLSFALPLSVLFATAFTLSDLYAKNELTVIFSSGVSLVRFTLPLLIVSVLLSFASFFFEDRIVVPTYRLKTEKQNRLLKEEPSKSTDRVVVISDGGNIIYKADYYDDANKRLYGAYIVVRDESKKVQHIIRAATAFWQDERWSFSDFVVYTYKDNELTIDDTMPAVVLSEPPETFQNIVVSIEEVSVRDSAQYISYLRRTGLPYAEALSQYYKKFSFPFILFIVVFLSVGLTGKTQKNVLLISLVLCVSAAVLFYVLQMVTMLLAKFGYVSPLVGAWFPVLLFTALSFVLLRFART